MRTAGHRQCRQHLLRYKNAFRVTILSANGKRDSKQPGELEPDLQMSGALRKSLTPTVALEHKGCTTILITEGRGLEPMNSLHALRSGCLVSPQNQAPVRSTHFIEIRCKAQARESWAAGPVKPSSRWKNSTFHSGDDLGRSNPSPRPAVPSFGRSAPVLHTFKIRSNEAWRIVLKS